jgi:CheY-like chemotaxis protein
MKREKVLIVDDDPVPMQAARAWLAFAGYTVITQSTPFGTSATVRREQPDIVLLDYAMPGLDGQELARIIQQQKCDHDISIIFYSGSQTPDKLERMAREIGALGSIPKTTSGNEFLTAFRQVIAKRRPQG